MTCICYVVFDTTNSAYYTEFHKKMESSAKHENIYISEGRKLIKCQRLCFCRRPSSSI